MKKKTFLSILTIAVTLSLASCGGGGGGGGTGGTITVDPQEVGLEEGYKPVKSAITKRSGKIKVSLVLDNAGQAGWKALASEYKRLHSDQVEVEIVSGYTNEDKYKTDLLEQETTTPKEPWNIVQGNLVSNTSNLYNMSKSFTAVNNYAGGKKWNTVLDEYATKNGSGRILNTENLSTAWFVNKDALTAAAGQGYKNKEGKAENPITWEDLINLCECMVKAGYSHPLGISLDSASVESTQFTWLVRVYGDYYYRNEYNNVIAPIPVYDPETGEQKGTEPYVLNFKDKQPEADANFKFCYTNFSNTILCTDVKESGVNNYVGAQSDKFKEFVGALYKMKPYLDPDASSTSFSTMRSRFASQADKNSPQILLDYFGNGLEFETHEGFNFDFFDYPYMSEGTVINKIKDENKGEYPMVRDVGGNGGYLSILNKGDTAQNELTLDFLNFVASPYGQTILYNTMIKTGNNPQGITTVKKVVVPEKWQKYFTDTKIQFNGNVDQNYYISLFIRFMSCTNSLTKKNGGAYWTELLTGKGTKTTTVVKFAQAWNSDIASDWETLCKERNWTSDAYKNEHWNDWNDKYLTTGK